MLRPPCGGAKAQSKTGRCSSFRPGRTFDRVVRVDVVEDAADRRLVVAELPQGHRHGPVDDLEHAAAGQLLVLDQRDVGLDPRGVAVHHEGDRAGRGEDGDLAVAIAVLAARSRGTRPRRRAASASSSAGAEAVDGLDGVAVHLHHPEHRLAIDGEASNAPDVRRVLGAGQIGLAVHDRRDRAGQRPAFVCESYGRPEAISRLPRLA